MGSDKNERAGNSLRRPRVITPSQGSADWEQANADLLRKVIAKAGIKRGALRFGYTRDGGAYSVGVYVGEDYFTDYIRPGEDVDKYLADLLSSLEDYTPGEALPTGKQRARR